MSAISTIQPQLAMPSKIDEIIAPPYDVLSVDEAKAISHNKEHNILHITRADADYDADTLPNDQTVHQQALNMLNQFQQEDIYQKIDKPVFLLYQLQQGNHRQTGLLCGADAFQLKRHEETRPDKVIDRFQLSECLKKQVSPILLSIKPHEDLHAIFQQTQENTTPLYEVTHQNNVHRLFLIDDMDKISAIECAFSQVKNIYIADGHHRAESHKQLHLAHPDVFSKHALAVIFLSNELFIQGYHRIVEKPEGFSSENFIKSVSRQFKINKSANPVMPKHKTTFGLYLDNCWYQLKHMDDVRLAVDILHQEIIEPYFNILSPREDKRIQFIGGHDASQKIMAQVNNCRNLLGLTLSPITMDEIMAVADKNQTLPPKSTWFEPKLLDGFLMV